MKSAFLALCLATPIWGQSPSDLGIFENQTDVGNPSLKGSAMFDPAAQTYRVTGAGANMWMAKDEFHFVWRQLSGDFALTATIRFPEPGAIPHRKAGIMVRQTLDGDSPYLDAVVHGSGLTEIQFREIAGAITHAIRFPVQGPIRIKLERLAGWFTMSAATEGQPLQELGAYPMKLNDPVYLGLLVCSHKADVIETAVFSDVSFQVLPKAPKKKEE